MEEFLAFLATQVLHIGGSDVTVEQLLSTHLFFLVGFMAVRWTTQFLGHQLRKRELGADVVHLLTRAWFILGLAILTISTLDLLNVPLAAFGFISGAVAIGVGFGAQNIINNFISGWILMWERPIRIGDFLEVGTMTGTVETINTRFTRIRRVDGVQMLVPNSHLLENTVINWTLMDELTRTSVRVGVAYGSPVRKVEELLQQAAKEQPSALDDPTPMVFFEDFGDSSLVFELSVWMYTSVERGLRVVRSDLRFKIDELLAANNIVIAFPQQDVHMNGELRITQAESPR